MEYEITDVKAGNVWTSPYGEMQSYTLVLKGVGEPVVLNKKCPVKHEPKEGETLFGNLEEKTNAKGNVYMKFTAQKPPEATGQTQTSNWHESPEKQQSINRAVALNNAVVSVGITDSADTVIELAERYYSWLSQTIEEVKDEPLGEKIDLDSIPF